MPRKGGKKATNPEPPEAEIAIGTTAVALALFGVSLILTA